MKPKQEMNKSILQRITGGVNLSADISTLVGEGFLPLLTAGGAMLPDEERFVSIKLTRAALDAPPPTGKRGEINTGQPIVRVRTKLLSSLVSSCSYIQRFLNNHPRPLGILPSSSMITELKEFASQTVWPSEAMLEEVTANLDKAGQAETVRHFQLLMRQLVRILCGGACEESDDYCNPFNHPLLRCSAFISMLRCFGKIAPDVHKVRQTRGTSPVGDDLISAYIDFLFDEEVPASSVLERRQSSVENHRRLSQRMAAIDLLSCTADTVSLQAERLILELFLEDAFSEVISTASGSCLDAKLQSIQSENVFTLIRTSPLKASPYQTDKDALRSNQYEPAIELVHKRARRMSTAMLGIRKTLPRARNHYEGDSLTSSPIPPKTLSARSSIEALAASTMGRSQWWPYLHEVLVQQWIAALTVLQDKDPHPILSPEGEDLCEIPYPLASSSLINASDSAKDVRVLLLDHSPSLFQIILKSLFLRMDKTSRTTPVILDPYFLQSLEILIGMLSFEAVARLSSGLARSRRLNLSLAQFLRRLLSVVAPVQVSQLIAAYFKKQIICRPEEIGLKLQVLEELGSFDYFVAVNIPAPLDARLIDPRRPSTFSSPRNISNLRGIQDPSTHWLARLFIDEVMDAYRQEEHSLASIRILRDLLVRHSYDVRYQEAISRHRIAVMYIPLLFHILAETEVLAISPFDSLDRRELLSILLFLLQDLPERQLREQWRHLARGDFDASRSAAFSRPEKRLSTERDHSSKPSSAKPLPIMKMLRLLHMILDTFDYPRTSKELEAVQAKILVGKRSETGDNLRSLDELMYGGRKKSEAPTRLPSANVRESTERKWAKQKVVSGKMHKEASLSNVNAAPGAPDLQLLTAATRGISHESTLIVLKTLSTILEEVPEILLKRDENESSSRTEAFEELMELSASVLLHGLLSNQSEVALVATMEQARTVLKRFGGRVFTIAVGDSMQDWLRRIFLFCAYPGAVLRYQSCDLMLLLFQSSFYHCSSLTLLKNTALSVFQDVIDTVISIYGPKIDSITKEDEYLSYLRASVIHMRDAAPTSMLLAPSSRQSLPNTTDGIALSAQLFDFMGSLDKILLGNAYIRRQLLHPVGYDWLGANILDGPYTEHSNNIVFRAHTERIRANNGSRPASYNYSAQNSSSPVGKARKVALQRLPEGDNELSLASDSIASQPCPVVDLVVPLDEVLDCDGVMELFVEVANIFDPILLPRIRMRWLENLVRLLDSKLHRAESAEVRWRLYLLCEGVRGSWEKLWAPREPLQWTGEGFGDYAARNIPQRNFLQLYTATTSSSGKWWSSPSQFKEHMETALTVGSSKFASISLFHLAERGYHSLLALYRQESRLADMSSVYQNISNLFRSHLSSSFAMGIFYRVLFLGRGTKYSAYERIWCPHSLK